MCKPYSENCSDMELLPLLTPATLLTLVVLILSVTLRQISISSNKTRQPQRSPPEPRGSWPIVGHLYQIAGSQLPHVTLSDLADKYGPIFTLKLGVNRALVISSSELAKECLVDKEVFLNRPHALAVEHMGYKSAMFSFSTYGLYWREVRKIFTIELLTKRKLEMSKHVRMAEVRAAIAKLLHKSRGGSSSTVEMKQWFENISLNVIIRSVAGKDLRDLNDGEYDQLQRSIKEYFHLFGVFVVSDSLPFLRWLDIGGYEKAMKRVARELDHMAQEWVDEHKKERENDKYLEKDTKDFIHVLLDSLESADQSEKFSGFESDTVVKATCLAAILTATDTSSITLAWALSLLLNNPDVLKKAQEELDKHVGRDRLLDESDMKNLVYLQAIVMETLRLYPAIPLLATRESHSDCYINGYHVTTGTQLIVNISRIHRDPHVWSNPDQFYPERFMTSHKHVDFKGGNSELIPFGGGKRICPGISYAMLIMQYTLGSLLQGFDIKTPLEEPVDMTQSLGGTCPKATSLDVILSPRLNDDLYKEA